ncbi:aspartic proteinase 36 isoform X1 [Rhododendron vialii]|uniref:aspartic proteinase 36 isoform X1 n=1 Tax=Rhododendron vialii TaxID=182163 RepID=UPI00266055ED|nr:aspartic proteinase 36 isoform X1 [Rhododendron vialii]
MVDLILMRKRIGFEALAVGLCFFSYFLLGSANVVFNVKHKFEARERRSLAALKAHDDRRHGRSLAAVDLPLGGNGSPTDTALYYTEIGLGTPPKDYYLQVDTGSDIMWVNCAGCENCPKKSDLGVELRLYDPKGSTTGTLLTCDQDFCIETFNPTGCKVGAICPYQVTYGDGSSSLGYFVSDIVQLNRASGNLQTTPMNGSVAFGCGAKQSGQLGTSAQALDGILGFGQANSSMISQIASAGKVKKMFAHCLDGTNGGGIFAIGQLVQPKLNSTPMVPNQAHYNVILKTVKVGRDLLQISTDVLDSDAGASMVIDSGTTLAYLADELYNPLITKVMDSQPNLKLHTVEQQFTCFQFTENVDDGFPAVTFGFENSLSLTIYPREYLFQIRDDVWCVGWQNSGMSKDGKEMNLLGDMVLSSKLVLYDLENQTIGWTEYNCSSSVKVKDEQSGAEYLIGPHDLSSFCSRNTGWSVTLFFLLAILHNYM